MRERRDEHDALRSSPVTHAEIEALPLWGRVAFAARCARGAVNALVEEQRVDERLLQAAVYAVIIAEQLSLGPSKWSVGAFAAVLGGAAASAARAALAAADHADAAKADAACAATARAAAYTAAAAADATKADAAYVTSAKATSAKAADVTAYATASADAATTAAYAYATFIQQRETYAALKKLMEGLDFTAPVPAVWFLGIPPMAATAQ